MSEEKETKESESLTEPTGGGSADAFRARYQEDCAAGQVRSLADYLQRWPDAKDGVVQAYLELECQRMASGGAVASDDHVQTPGSLGPYRLIRELGRGGQAVVWLAEDQRLHRKVALKVLEGWRSASNEALRRFQREAEAASRLDHPGICTVYDTGIAGHVPWIAMRYVEGETLAHRIRKGQDVTASEGPSVIDLSESKADTSTPGGPRRAEDISTTRAEIQAIVRLVEEAARALHAAHEAGIVHRDIKPGNIMITPDGRPVLLDFGLARLEDDAEVSLTRTGDLFGTPAYLSPEQLAGQRIALDRRTDVWSLGVTLYECLTLRRPFEAPTRQALYQTIMTKEPQALRSLNRTIPRDLSVIVATALEKDRDRRYQTALGFAEDLRRIQSKEPIRARPVGLWTRGRRWVQRHPATTLSAALILLILTGACFSLLGIVADAEHRLSWIQKENLLLHFDRIQEKLAKETEMAGAGGFDADAFVRSEEISWPGWGERTQTHRSSESQFAIHYVGLQLDIDNGREVQASYLVPYSDSIPLEYHERSMELGSGFRSARLRLGFDPRKYGRAPHWWSPLLVGIPLMLWVLASTCGVGAIVAGFVALQGFIHSGSRRVLPADRQAPFSRMILRTVVIAAIVLCPLVIGVLWFIDRYQYEQTARNVIADYPLKSKVVHESGEVSTVIFAHWSIGPFGVLDIGTLRLAFLGESSSSRGGGSLQFPMYGHGGLDSSKLGYVHEGGNQIWTFQGHRFTAVQGELTVAGKTFDIISGPPQLVIIARNGTMESVRPLR